MLTAAELPARCACQWVILARDSSVTRSPIPSTTRDCICNQRVTACYDCRDQASGSVRGAPIESRPSTLLLTCNDGLDDSFGLMRISDLDGLRACFFGRIIVPTGEHSVSDEDHLSNRYMKDIPELSDSVGLIDPMLRDIDRGRTAQAHGKLGDERIKDRLDLLSLRKLRIPLLLFVNRSLLAQGGERDLASSVLNNLAPDFFNREWR